MQMHFFKRLTIKKNNALGPARLALKLQGAHVTFVELPGSEKSCSSFISGEDASFGNTCQVQSSSARLF